MEFRILGPMEVTAETGDVTPTAPKVRQVLALLLLRCNGLVQTGEFIDELWGECPPRSALSTLQTYIYKLRKVLLDETPGGGPPGSEEMLRTKPSGYILKVLRDNVDVGRFERRAEEGAQALEENEPERAAAALSQALTVWRGPALADVAAGELLGAYATRLEESRMRALELRIEADLQLGRHHSLVGELKMLTATHRLHEGLHAKLMLALHRSGRRYEALNVYRQLREVLIEDLGLEPSPALNRIHRALLASDPALDARPREVAPPVSRPVVQAAPAPVAVPSRLPVDLSDFTGRREELERIERSLLGIDHGGPAGGVVSISGMPAAGKTALAVHAAHRLADHFPDGQIFCGLNSGGGTPSAPEDVVARLLTAAGFAADRIPADLDGRAALLRSWASGRRMLLVLDDAAGMAQLQPLLPAVPGLGLIVTSLLPLPVSGAVICLEPLSVEEGTGLLARMAGADRVAGSRAAAEQIVRACGGLPLAIKAAGSRLAATPTLSLDHLGQQLVNHDTRLDLLRYGKLDVRARYHCSYRQLADRDQAAFRLISLLRQSSFTADEVSPLLGQESENAEQLLARLADRHLLRAAPDGDGGPVRYEFHELTWLYARERLEHALEARVAA
jgi:DNA-binding SARP family transcriptional activator